METWHGTKSIHFAVGISKICKKLVKNTKGEIDEVEVFTSSRLHLWINIASISQVATRLPTNLPDYHLRCLASSASRKVVRLRSLSRLAWLLDSIVALFDTRDQNGTPKTWHLKKSRDWWTWNFRKLYMYNSSNWLASVGEGYSQTHTHLSEHLFIRELPIFHFDKCRINFQTRIKGMLEGSQINHP